jgi:parvulin-like peptidyl-prolyl isomerase
LAAGDGDLIGPLTLWRTYALVKLEKRIAPDFAALDSLALAVRNKVIEAKRADALRAYAEMLKTEIPVKVNLSLIDSLIFHMQMGIPAASVAIATVGDRVLTESDLRKKYIHKAAEDADREAHAVLREVYEEQLQVMLFKEAAARAGYANSESVKSRSKSYEDSILVQSYLENVIALKISVTDAEVQEYYDKYKTRFREMPRLKVATLTRVLEEDALDDYNKLKSGADFAWLAKRNSVDEWREKGGERDWMTAEQLPVELFRALDSLKTGAFTAPMKAENGFIIVQLVDREEGEQKSFDKVSSVIRLQIERQKQLEAIDEAVKALRGSAKIQVMEEVVKELRIVGRNQ